MGNGWRLADRPEVIQAFDDGGTLLFFLLGKKRAPCYELRIGLAPEDIWPPIYTVEWRETPGPCPDVITGYYLVVCLEQKSSEYVTVRDTTGQQQVRTQLVGDGILRSACQQIDGP